MGFSITSAVLGGIIIICYSIAIAIYSDYFYYARYSHNTDMALAVITLILGIVEFAIGIWAAVCCCIMQICCCGAPPQQVRILSLVKHILAMQNFERAYHSIFNEYIFRGTYTSLWNLHHSMLQSCSAHQNECDNSQKKFEWFLSGCFRFFWFSSHSLVLIHSTEYIKLSRLVERLKDTNYVPAHCGKVRFNRIL